MNNKSEKFHSLSRRIVAQFCIFTLALSAIYGLLCFLLLYSLEDDFIEREVKQEANYLVETYRETGQWSQARSEHMALYFSTSSLPDDIRQQFIDEPQRKEFFGAQGRHYHLYPLPEYNNVYLVAQVSERLLVRPIRGSVLTLLLISGTALTFIAFIIAWLLGRKTATPLKQLADLVDGVAPQNIPHTFADQFPNNEIGILARTLENSMQQISKALAREKCFTRDVSHELRTPVAIVKNAVELCQEKNIFQEQDKQIISRISEAAMQMEQTVTTLLVLAREEHTSAQKTQVKLLPLIEQSILDHRHILEGKCVDVQVHDNCNAVVCAQQGMLKVLLDNLLSNAFQYTESGEVKVSFIDNELTIEDTGSGIEQAISAQVTEPAIKGSQSTGYGFGLSIVKRLCEHQHWQLTVVSNKGTSISVAFR
ncbi:sensor histidine kinase [Colwelliaceae bacterium 6471]